MAIWQASSTRSSGYSGAHKSSATGTWLIHRAAGRRGRCWLTSPFPRAPPGAAGSHRCCVATRSILYALFGGVLSEARRLTGWGNEHLSGDPLQLEIPADCHVDARRLLEGELPERPAGELLEGLEFPGLGSFGHWLLSERQYLAAREQALLRDRALVELVTGRFDWATAVARRAVDQDPLETRNQEVLALPGGGRADR